jgi:hypothetical protein
VALNDALLVRVVHFLLVLKTSLATPLSAIEDALVVVVNQSVDAARKTIEQRLTACGRCPCAIGCGGTVSHKHQVKACVSQPESGPADRCVNPTCIIADGTAAELGQVHRCIAMVLPILDGRQHRGLVGIKASEQVRKANKQDKPPPIDDI